MGKIVCLFLVGLAVALAAAQNVSLDPEQPDKSTTAAPPTTSEVSTTTLKPTTTPKSTTETPTTSSTTTTTTTTTTPAPPPTTSTTTTTTTTTPPPPPTTPSTTTTTTVAPSPTPAPPAPKPVEPETGTWRVNLTSASNVSCIVARMAVQLEVPYVTKENKTQMGYVNLAKEANVSGSCLPDKQFLELDWEKNWVRFVFEKENEEYGVSMVEVFVVEDPKFFPNNKDDKVAISAYSTSLFKVGKAKSFKCDKVQVLDMINNKNKTVVKFHLSHLQMQAFLTNTTQNFSDAVDCEPFSTPDIVPIAAGCTLAALIIVVLVGYLLGRRRSQARGYLSMFTQTKREEDYIPMKNLSCFN